MVAWYYAVGQDQHGPVGEDDIRALIRDGRVVAQTFVWHEGMDEWQEAGPHPKLCDAFVTPPPLPTTLTPGIPRPTFASPAAPANVIIMSRPWPRFWARFIDNFLFVPLLGFCVGLLTILYAPDIYLRIYTMNDTLFGVLLLPAVSLVLALSMIVTGTTPGKAIMGVRVPVPENRSRMPFFLVREFKVWLVGLGLGIPLVALFTQIYQYKRLVAGGAASYDDGNPVVVANPSKFRLWGAIAVAAALLAGNIALRFEDDNVSGSIQASQWWSNPITQKAATIGKSWQLQELDINNGRAFYFISDELLAEAIFGYEQLPSEGVDNTVYADAIKDVVAAHVTITSAWEPVTVRGIAAVRARGKAATADDAVVEVTVAVIGRNAWRTLVFTRGRSTDQAALKEDFVDAMFGTAN